MLIDNYPIGITLKFLDEKLESEFLEDVFFGNLLGHRLIYLGGTFLYTVFFILDCYLMRDQLLSCVFIRFFVVCPMLLTTYFLVGKPLYEKYFTAISLINGFGAGGGVLLLMVQATSSWSPFYYGGLILCCLFFYVFQPKQVLSNVLAWGVLGLYMVVTAFFTDTPGAIFLHNSFVFIFFNIGGMFACYSMELSQRKEFIHKFTVQDQADRLYHALSEVEQQREKAQRLSLQDSLSGLPNRRHFFSVLANELEHSCQIGQEVSLILVEVDNFKQVNDRLGHVAGDQILALVGGIIGDIVRKDDTPCRYGGEKFAVFLPNASSQIAEKIGRRIMEYVECADISVGHAEEFLTASVGVVTLPPGQQFPAEDFIDFAGQALYKAKNCGSNQLRKWTEDLQGYGA